MHTQKKVHPSIFYCNAFSIRNKIDEWRLVIADEKPDIACVTESKLSEMDSDTSVKIAGYDILRHDRTERPGGSVCMWILNGMGCKQLQLSVQIPAEIECMWVLFEAFKIAVDCVYGSPNINTRKFQSISLTVVSVKLVEMS